MNKATLNFIKYKPIIIQIKQIIAKILENYPEEIEEILIENSGILELLNNPTNTNDYASNKAHQNRIWYKNIQFPNQALDLTIQTLRKIKYCQDEQQKKKDMRKAIYMIYKLIILARTDLQNFFYNGEVFIIQQFIKIITEIYQKKSIDRALIATQNLTTQQTLPLQNNQIQIEDNNRPTLQTAPLQNNQIQIEENNRQYIDQTQIIEQIIMEYGYYSILNQERFDWEDML